MSTTSRYPNIPQEQYKERVLAEARLDVIHDLNKTGFVYETAIKEARVKDRKSRLSCDYEPVASQADSKRGDEGDVDQLVDNVCCDSAYSRDGEGEDVGGQGSDGH